MIRCDASQIERLAGVAARAFFNDPLYQYLFPNPDERFEPTFWDLGKTIEYAIRFGEVHATSTLSGFCGWLPPGETDFSEERMAEVGMLDCGAVIGAEAERRLIRFISESEKYHRKAAPGLHWYLLLLAVDPARQGSGIGSELLAPLFEKADSSGLPIYLETLSAKNVPYYQRRGFEIRCEAPLSDGGAYIWYMVREPDSRQYQREQGLGSGCRRINVCKAEEKQAAAGNDEQQPQK